MMSMWEVKQVADYIDREQAIDTVNRCTEVFVNNLPTMVDKETVMHMLSEVPSADVRENVRGEWLEADDEDPCYYRCSICGRMVDVICNFCPNCGADMRGEDNGTIN